MTLQKVNSSVPELGVAMIGSGLMAKSHTMGYRNVESVYGKTPFRPHFAILADANFDCLATTTTAGLLICSDPALANADRELNALFVGLIARLRDDEAKGALAEYARWTRTRDRLCDLDDKDNVPLEELSAAEPCLADYIKQKAAEFAAVKDPRRVFGREVLSPAPDADAVDLCVGKIHSTNTCENFLRISRVTQLDTEVSAQEAIVTAEIEMKVLAPFAICSPIASLPFSITRLVSEVS